MDTKITIKEENPLTNDIASQNERGFCTNNVTLNTNIDASFLDNDFDEKIKTEIKSETPFPDFYSQKEREYSSRHLAKESRSETVTSSNSRKIGMKTEIEEQTLVSDFGSQDKREFFLEDPIMKVKKYDSDHEMDNKMEIKEEPWWLGTETSSVCDDIKDEGFAPVKSSRLCTKAESGGSSSKSILPSAEVSGRERSFYNEKDCPEYESNKGDVTEIPTIEEYSHSKSGKYCDGREMNSRALYLKQNNLMHKGESPHKCTVCKKRFTHFCDLKIHRVFYKGTKPHQCKTCDKSFSYMSDLKRHNLIHKGKKPYKCKICEKSFTQLSNMKRHNLIHEGKKPYKCKICDKCFTRLSSVKRHNLIHEGKICDKRFIQLSDLERENFIHESKMPYQCNICDKNFTQLVHSISHNLFHEGKKSHQCKTFDTSFY